MSPNCLTLLALGITYVVACIRAIGMCIANVGPKLAAHLLLHSEAIMGHSQDVPDQPAREDGNCIFARAQIDNSRQRLRAEVGLSLKAAKSVTDLQLT
jgi:hypothetical protein